MAFTNFILVYGIVVSSVALVVNILTKSGIRRINYLASALLILWPILDLYNLNMNPANQILLSQSATIVLSTSLYLKHYFYDELSATFRQRKTMTLGSIAYGTILATVWIDGTLIVEPTRILVHPFIILVLILQGGLLTHRIIMHLSRQTKLSDSYKIPSIFTKKNTYLVISLLVVLVLTSVFLLVQNNFSGESGPFVIVVTTGYLFINILTYLDPLASLPVTQPVQAVAYIPDSPDLRSQIYVIASDTDSIVSDDDFADFISEISNLLKEITKSESKLLSFSSSNLIIKVQPTTDGNIVAIFEKNTPLISQLMREISILVDSEGVNTEVQFASIVNRVLKLPNHLLMQKYLSKVAGYTVVYNDKSAGFKKAKRLWADLLNSQKSISVSEFSEEWVSVHKPNGVVIMGGDGTVHTICNELLKGDIDLPVSILPAGGGNDIYARWLVNSVDAFNEHGEAHFPVLEVRYGDRVEYALNTVEWGIGSLVAQKREENHGWFLKGMPKYFYLLIKSLFKYKSWEADVVIDDKVRKFPMLSAAVIGFGSSMLGGGYKMFPERMEGSTKEKVYMLVAQNFERFSGLSLIVKLARAKQYEDSRVTHYEVSKGQLVPNGTEIPLTIDGELHKSPPIEFRISEKKIKVKIIG